LNLKIKGFAPVIVSFRPKKPVKRLVGLNVGQKTGGFYK
jgi:hypothetical protein